MSKTKFTPGPWEWCDSYSEYTDQKTQSLVGNDGYDSILCCDGESNSPPCLGETGEANAHLIAAAPDLYAELETLVAELETLWDEGETDDLDLYEMEDLEQKQEAKLLANIETAKAALAKARGEKP